MILEEELLALERKLELLEAIEVFPCNLNFQFSVGSVFALETNLFPLYGVVLGVAQNESNNQLQFVYLTLHLSLASIEAPILVINDDIFKFAKLTHITRSVASDKLSLAARPLKPVSDVSLLVQWVEKLRGFSYGPVHQRFFEIESRFVDYVLEYVSSLDKIIKIPDDLRAIFDEELRTILAASTTARISRFDKVFLVSSRLGPKFYFDDSLVGKLGRISVRGIVVYEGRLLNELVLLHFNKFLPLLGAHDIAVELWE